MAIPAYAPVGLALALGFNVELSLQTSYTADLAAIINSNSAFVLGGVVALIVTRLMRAIGTQASARRLMRAIYRDLADLAAGRSHPTRDQWASPCWIVSRCCCTGNRASSRARSMNSPMRSKICGSASI